MFVSERNKENVNFIKMEKKLQITTKVDFNLPDIAANLKMTF